MRCLDAPQLVDLELLLGGELLPQVVVAGLDVGGDLPRVDVAHELAHLLWRSSSPPATFSGGDLQVNRPLAVAESVVPLGRLDVDDVRRDLAGITAKQRVRQRAVTPEEPGEVEPHQQPDQRIEQALAEVRDVQTRAR